MALTLVAEIVGEDVAKAIQLGIEYDPQPPFDSRVGRDRGRADGVARAQRRGPVRVGPVGRLRRMAAAVADNPQLGRYEISVDGELAGSVTYRRHPGVIEFVHTEIDPRFEGHGLASQLSRSVLDTARADGLQVIPICPFVRAFIREHHDYLHLVPAGRRAGFDLPEA